MEEGVEPVEILLRQRIVFVIVAARAVHGQPQPDGRGGLDAVGAIFGEKFLRNNAAFLVDHVVAVKSRGDFLVKRGIGQEIAGKLFDGELVEREVAVESADDPVAPGPHFAVPIDLIAIAVRKARRVEPVLRHPLAVTWRGEQTIHQIFVGEGRGVGQKCFRFAGRRREAGQVERQSPQERGFVGLSRRLQMFLIEPRQDEAVNGRPRPGRLFHFGQLRGSHGEECPVVAKFGALGNPAAKQLLLVRG